MLDEVYTKSQSIMYIGDKENSQHGQRSGIHQAESDFQ